jgi:adenylate cyclase, class 2
MSSSSSSSTFEREVKLRFESVDAARAAIARTEATPLRCRRLQDDYMLDDLHESLRQRRCVLRVRIESGRSLLTFKGPVQASVMKLREEVETVVGDGETLLKCFEHLGYRVWFRYQKYREEYALNDVVIAIDETPVGVFVEIEGGEQGIGDTAEALGCHASDYLLDSYRGLFMEHRRAHGLPDTDMVFGDGA